MPKYRDLPQKYNISGARYRELLYFCRQYYDKKQRAEDTYSLPSSAPTGMPHGSATLSTVERQADAAVRDKADVELIERCLKQVCDGDFGIYDALLLNVTKGTLYEYLPVPCGRRQFYEKRRKFFWLLDREKG